MRPTNPLDERQLHLTRREFFGRSATGIGTAALASLLGRDGMAAQSTMTAGGLADLPHFAPKAKRVIYLFMNGAPTHVDLYDWKPKLKELHGEPVPDAYVGKKRFSTMTGNPKGKLMLAPIEPFAQHGESGATVSGLLPHIASVADDSPALKLGFKNFPMNDFGAGNRYHRQRRRRFSHRRNARQ